MTIHGDSEPKRSLTPLNAWSIAFGCIIGRGAFAMPGTMFLPQAGPLGTTAAMLVGMGAMLLFGFNCAFMMNALPGEGGAYSYVRETFGRKHAFLCAWLLCFSYVVIIPLNASSLYSVGGRHFQGFLHAGVHYQIAGSEVYLRDVLAIQAIILLFGALSLLRQNWLRKLQTVLALTTVAAVAVFFVYALVTGRLGQIRPLFGMNRGPEGMLTVVLLTPWAFVGFDTLSWSTREYRFPTERSFRIIALSILVGGCTYTALTWITACGVPEGCGSWRMYLLSLEMHEGLAKLPTFFAAKALLGTPGLVLMFVAAAAAVLTCIIGFFRAACRVLPAVAEDEALPRRFTREGFSTAFVVLLSMLLPFLGNVALGWLTDMASVGAIVGFGWISAAAFRLAKKKGRDDVRTTGLAGVAISILIAALQMIPGLFSTGSLPAGAFAVLAAWCALGCALYRSPRQPEGKSGFAWNVWLLCLAVLFAAVWLLRTVNG